MENSIYYNNKQYKILYCNNYINSSHSIHAIVDAYLVEFELKEGEIEVYYNGKYYKSNHLNVFPSTSIIGRIELRIQNLIDITRDYKINKILDE